MSSLDHQLGDMLADGRITTGDVEAVQEFAEFLGKFGSQGDTSPGAVRRRRRALLEHADFCGLSDADVARLQAAEDADRG